MAAALAGCFPACGGESRGVGSQRGGESQQGGESNAGGTQHGGGTQQEPEETVELGELRSKVADILCESLASCCKEVDVDFDAEVCWRVVSASVSQALRLDPANVTYDGAAAARCLEQAQKDATCDDLGKMVRLALSPDDSALPHALPASCRQAFFGKLPLGAPCESDFECAKPEDGADVVCSYAGRDSRTCQLYRSAGEGVVAGVAGDTCERSCASIEDCYLGSDPSTLPVCLYSDGLGCYENICEPLAKLGEPCKFGLPCENGSYCDISVCVPQSAEGEACSFGDECPSGHCIDGVCGERDPIVYACERLPR